MVSLGLATLSNTNHSEEGFLDSSIGFLNHHFGNPEKSLSLFNFKKKFQPAWESRYLVYSSTLRLPRIGWALYHAHQRDVSLIMTLSQGLKPWQGRLRAGQKQPATTTGALKP